MFDKYPDILKVEDIMKILRISRNTAYNLVKQEGFPLIRIKSDFRIPKQQFIQWIEQTTLNKTL